MVIVSWPRESINPVLRSAQFNPKIQAPPQKAGPPGRNWTPEKSTLVLACTDRNYMHDISVTPKLSHQVRHICCADEISGNQWSRGPTAQAWLKPKNIHVFLVIFSFRWQQYHHYHSPKFKICYITRNEETGIHTDLHQLLQNCTAWSRWYRDWRPQASRPKPFVFMATFSYILYKEIYEKLEFTGHGRGIRTPECTLSCENHHRWTPNIKQIENPN